MTLVVKVRETSLQDGSSEYLASITLNNVESLPSSYAISLAGIILKPREMYSISTWFDVDASGLISAVGLDSNYYHEISDESVEVLIEEITAVASKKNNVEQN